MLYIYQGVEHHQTDINHRDEKIAELEAALKETQLKKQASLDNKYID